MPADAGPGDTTLAPDDAFAALGNETRMDILQTLGAVTDPLPFSELRDRVGIADSGQFNYHLGQLEGHFIRKTDAGYVLRQAGHRIREAVLSGAVTEAVVVEPTGMEAPCPYCGSAIEVSYREERLLIRCTECVGAVTDQQATSEAFGTLPKGTVTLLHLPSAAFKERSEAEVLEAAHAWTYTEHVSVANDLCPRCTGRIDLSVEVCPDHQPDPDICELCNFRFGVVSSHRCRNCGHTKRGTFVHHLFGEPAFRAFFEARGIDPLAPAWDDLPALYNFEEEIQRSDPMEVTFKFSVTDDVLSLTVDESLEVIGKEVT